MNKSSLNEQQQKDIILIKQEIEKAANYQKEPDKFCQLFTDDAIVVNVVGIRMVGKNEIYKFMKKAVKSNLANVYVKNEILDITFIRPDIAVVSAVQHIFIKNGYDLKENSKGSVTNVMVKHQGNWLSAVAQNTFIQE